MLKGVKLLLRKSANPEIVVNCKMTVMELAEQNGYGEVVKALKNAKPRGMLNITAGLSSVSLMQREALARAAEDALMAELEAEEAEATALRKAEKESKRKKNKGKG